MVEDCKLERNGIIILGRLVKTKVLYESTTTERLYNNQFHVVVEFVTINDECQVQRTGKPSIDFNPPPESVPHLNVAINAQKALVHLVLGRQYKSSHWSA